MQKSSAGIKGSCSLSVYSITRVESFLIMQSPVSFVVERRGSSNPTATTGRVQPVKDKLMKGLTSPLRTTSY